jgi:AmmeMemoRadiSam system protein B
VWTRGSFALPGDRVPVDDELTARLIDAGVGFVEDKEAHRYEHALEVELPFIRARNPAAIVTPVILGGLDGAECVALGRTLATIVEALDEEVLVVASSDMSHYLPDDVTRATDRKAIEPMLAADPKRLYDVVEGEAISMCGILPATTMLSYARARGASHGTLVAYGTSADAFGDYDRVVGYAGISVD